MTTPGRSVIGELEPGRGWRELAKQTVLVACAIVFYFAVRGLTEGSEQTAVANGLRVLDLEGALGLAHEQTLQDWFSRAHWLTTLVNWVYIWLHWPVIIATLLWLHHTRIGDYLVLRNAIFISGAIGLVVFVSLPVAPPRLLPSGFIDTVTEYSNSYRVLQPPGLVNKYAAIPSLHVGWNVIVGIALFTASSRLLIRSFALVSPALMAIAVVATANHYVVDGMLGAVIALIGLVLARRITPILISIERRITRRDQIEIVDDHPIDAETS